jgi:hypothetical protein
MKQVTYQAYTAPGMRQKDTAIITIFKKFQWHIIAVKAKVLLFAEPLKKNVYTVL